jgi:hypothetical protein
MTYRKGPCVLSQPITYRRDRWGECWHMVPSGDLGPRGRSVCGEPRQGTPLSEGYAEIEPSPPECICQRCTAASRAQPRTRSTQDV